MSGQDHDIDQLFQQAKNAPPVLSLDEVKDMLKSPDRNRFRSSRRWFYFAISVIVFLGLLSWYKFSPLQEDDHKTVSVNKPVVPEVKPTAAMPTQDTVMVPVTHSIDKTAQVQHASNEKLESTINRADTLSVKKVDSTAAPHQVTAPYIVEKNELIIPWFADRESLKKYQDKLLQSGIQLEIKEVVYNDKDLGRPFITALKADILVGDSLYKSIQLKDFKEFHIIWIVSNTGEVRIKSVSMIDKNFMSRKL